MVTTGDHNMWGVEELTVHPLSFFRARSVSGVWARPSPVSWAFPPRTGSALFEKRRVDQQSRPQQISPPQTIPRAVIHC